MKSGFCPKCGSNEVKVFDKVHKVVSDKTVLVDDYVCMDCGYTEAYVRKYSLYLLDTQQNETNDKKKKRDSL